MKTDKIIWGLVLVFVGGVLLLENFNVIDFQWMAIWRFWPIVLILIGANMLLARANYKSGGMITVVLTVAALAFIAWKGVDSKPVSVVDWVIPQERSEGAGKSKKSVYSEDYKGLKYAELNISGGGMSYSLLDTASELFAARVSSTIGSYSLKRASSDSTDILDFKMGGTGSGKKGSGGRNNAVISLNTRPIWDMHIESGASKATFDLSSFKIRNLNFEGGASFFELKLGEPLTVSRIKIATGASKIIIRLPDSIACRVDLSSGLTSTSLPGLKQVKDDVYETEGYARASRKYDIVFEGALSNFKVERF